MSQGLYSGVSGLAIGVGLYKGTQGLWSGASGLITGDGGSTLSLNFLAGAPLDPRITFTRSSTATFVGSNGLIQTAAVDAPRFDYNPANLTAKGLLIEQQRTNILIQSADFTNAVWVKTIATATGNTATAPDGTLTADTLTIPATNNANVGQAFAGVSGTTYTHSSWVWVASGTATFQMHLLDALGWGTAVTVSVTATTTPTRVTVTKTSAASGTHFIVLGNSIGTAGSAGTFFAWGSQVEAGAFATSYIPTVASQVTRSADVATMTGTNFSSWFNSVQGTFVGSFDAFSPASTMLWAGISDGTSSNRMQSGSSSGSALFVNVGGVNQVALSSSAVTANTITNRAITYKTDDFAVCTSGGSVATDTLGTLPTVDRLAVGGLDSGGQLNGHIRSLTYYPSRLPDATLQALTS